MARGWISVRAPDGRDGRDGEGGPHHPGRQEPARGPTPERAINAPWPALAIVLAMLLAYAAQATLGGGDLAAERFGFRPALLGEGGWTGLFTAPWVHAGWLHVGFNALAGLAFGAPVARRFGSGAAKAAAFALFYVVCGVIASIGFAPFHLYDGSVLVGASGAVAGLMGASSRLIGPHARGRLAPFTQPTVLAMAGSWLLVNLIFGALGVRLGVAGDAPLAWEAHLFGYAAGLFLIAPAVRLLDEGD